MKTPNRTFVLGRRLVMAQLNITTHNGSVAISKAASPDARYFSAQVTPPLPHSNSKAPMIKARGHSESEARILSPWATAHTNRINPALRNREAAIRNGGSVSIA
jgi:hypothetical protein